MSIYYRIFGVAAYADFAGTACLLGSETLGLISNRHMIKSDAALNQLVDCCFFLIEISVGFKAYFLKAILKLMGCYVISKYI
jgi:hypothetical protein